MKTPNEQLKRLISIALLSSSLLLSACSISSVDAADSLQIQTQEPMNSSGAEFSDAQFEQMLAPIALYPDSLLTHILIAATYPLEVVMASQFHSTNKQFSDEQLMKKAETMDWDPSVAALLAFPTVLEKLSNDLSWTQDLGDAFLENEVGLLGSIQSLRAQAYSVNSLSKMKNMSVTHEHNQIIIEPIQREVVYVPYYDPRVVYGHWRWHNYPPVYWAPFYGYTVHPHSYFHWNRGVRIRSNFFFSAFHWSNHRVVVIDHHHSRRYRHRSDITNSHTSKSWHHKPHHRRGVAYSNSHLKKRYKSHRPIKKHRKEHEKDLRRSTQKVVKHTKAKTEKHYTDKSKRVQNTNKHVKQKREENFAKRLRNSHEPVRKHQTIGGQKRVTEDGQHRFGNLSKKNSLQRDPVKNSIDQTSHKRYQTKKSQKLAKGSDSFNDYNRSKRVYKAPPNHLNNNKEHGKQGRNSEVIVKKTKVQALRKDGKASRVSLPKNRSLKMRTERR
jgi:hypothetical protein